MSPTYQVALARTCYFHRWPCFLCGGQTEKDGVEAVFVDEAGGNHDVCWECLEAGSEQAPARLIARAERLEETARALRRDAEATWKLPAFDEYRRLVKEVGEELEAAFPEEGVARRHESAEL